MTKPDTEHREAKEQKEERQEEWPYPGFGKQVAIGLGATYIVVAAIVAIVYLFSRSKP